MLAQALRPRETLKQLLAIVYRFTQDPNELVADSVIATPRLVPAIIQTFLLTPIPPRDVYVLPMALRILTILAFTALGHLEPTDAILRFATHPKRRCRNYVKRSLPFW